MDMKNQNLHIKHQQKIDEKIKEFIKDGASSFHVVADFDGTLTHGFSGEKKVHSGYACIRNGNYLPKEYITKLHTLANNYYPIEISHSISQKEKNNKMSKWWINAWKLLKEGGITLQILQEIAHKNETNLRKEVDQFFNSLRRENIPTLIFSAGIGNLIQEIFNENNFTSSNIHIISNFFEFDASGKAIGYNKNPIHTFNKNETHVKDHKYHLKIENKKNVILIGDNLGDISMCNGLAHDCIISIAFFNYKIDDKPELFDQFLETFDIVLTGDDDFSYINNLLQKIIQK
jgi:cytosolic 5'-nucleotidase 3